jgi:hypothetical protein
MPVDFQLVYDTNTIDQCFEEIVPSFCLLHSLPPSFSLFPSNLLLLSSSSNLLKTHSVFIES